MGIPKALVHNVDGTSWLARAVDTLAGAGCSPVVVVLGAQAGRARVLLDLGPQSTTDVSVVEAADWATGMGASLRRGLHAAASTTAHVAVVTLVDLPDVGVPVVTRVLQAAADDPTALLRAAYQGRPGHPVVLGRGHWDGAARAAVGDQGARDYLDAHAVVEVECGDLATGRDRDTHGGTAGPSPERGGGPGAEADG